MSRITLQKVIEVINNLDNKKGVSSAQIINYFRSCRNICQQKRNLVCEIHRLLKKGLSQGILKFHSRNYKLIQSRHSVIENPAEGQFALRINHHHHHHNRHHKCHKNPSRLHYPYHSFCLNSYQHCYPNYFLSQRYKPKEECKLRRRGNCYTMGTHNNIESRHINELKPQNPTKSMESRNNTHNEMHNTNNENQNNSPSEKKNVRRCCKRLKWCESCGRYREVTSSDNNKEEHKSHKHCANRSDNKRSRSRTPQNKKKSTKRNSRKRRTSRSRADVIKHKKTKLQKKSTLNKSKVGKTKVNSNGISSNNHCDLLYFSLEDEKQNEEYVETKMTKKKTNRENITPPPPFMDPDAQPGSNDTERKESEHSNPPQPPLPSDDEDEDDSNRDDRKIFPSHNSYL